MMGGVIVFRKCPDVALKHFVASNYGEGVLYHEDVLKPHLRCTSDTPLPCHHWSNVVWVCQSVGFFRAGAAYILSHILALTHVDVAKRLQYGGFLVSLYSKFVHSHLKIHTFKKQTQRILRNFPTNPKKHTPKQLPRFPPRIVLGGRNFLRIWTSTNSTTKAQDNPQVAGRNSWRQRRAPRSRMYMYIYIYTNI